MTTAAVEKLKEADIIVSTGHAPFEERISDLKRQGELKGVLIVITELKGIRILLNPSIDKPNLHMPIYDPKNYMAFLNEVAEE